MGLHATLDILMARRLDPSPFPLPDLHLLVTFPEVCTLLITLHHTLFLCLAGGNTSGHILLGMSVHKIRNHVLTEERWVKRMVLLSRAICTRFSL